MLVKHHASNWSWEKQSPSTRGLPKCVILRTGAQHVSSCKLYALRELFHDCIDASFHHSKWVRLPFLHHSNQRSKSPLWHEKCGQQKYFAWDFKQPGLKMLVQARTPALDDLWKANAQSEPDILHRCCFSILLLNVRIDQWVSHRQSPILLSDFRCSQLVCFLEDVTHAEAYHAHVCKAKEQNMFLTHNITWSLLTSALSKTLMSCKPSHACLG